MTIKTLVITFFFIAIHLPSQAQKPKLKKAFNGKNLKGWVVPENNIWWTAQNGILTVKNGPDKKGSILWTKKEYQDFIMELDFFFGPGNVDSGVFIRTEKEQIQIGISGSLKRDMTASPYIAGKGYPVEANNVAQLLKLKDWNSMKIRAAGNHYTVWLNGEQVMSFVSEDAIPKGAIGLQLHANREMKILYRNIKIAKL